MPSSRSSASSCSSSWPTRSSSGRWCRNVRPAAATPAAANPGATASPTVPLATGPSASPSSAPTGPTAVLVGAGDIATCGSTHDEATAALVEAIPGIVFTAGDNAYNVRVRGRVPEMLRPVVGAVP